MNIDKNICSEETMSVLAKHVITGVFMEAFDENEEAVQKILENVLKDEELFREMRIILPAEDIFSDIIAILVKSKIFIKENIKMRVWGETKPRSSLTVISVIIKI